MIIFMDDPAFHIEARGGVSRYASLLASLLAQREEVQCVHLFAGWTRNAFALEAVGTSKLRVHRMPRPRRFVGGDLARLVSLCWRRVLALSLHGDRRKTIYHASFYPVDPVLARVAGATVCTIHDMIPENMNHPGSAARRYRRQKAAAVARSSRIACVSDYTARELVRHFPQAKSKLRVVHNTTGLFGHAPSLSGNPQSSPCGAYFLMVGQRGGYKNGEIAFRAFAEVRRRLPDLQLVLCGGSSTASEQRLIDDLGIAPAIVHCFPDDAQLAQLYAGATALLYPSRAEGFGLPLLEGMLLGCPVVTTPLASLPEIGGSAALYASPDDLQSWVKTMEALHQDAMFRQRIVQAGRVQSLGFRPEVHSRKMVQFYQEALNPSSYESA